MRPETGTAITESEAMSFTSISRWERETSGDTTHGTTTVKRRGENGRCDRAPCQAGLMDNREGGETQQPPCLQLVQRRLACPGLLHGRRDGEGQRARSVNLYCPSTSLFSTQGEGGAMGRTSKQGAALKKYKHASSHDVLGIWFSFQGGDRHVYF